MPPARRDPQPADEVWLAPVLYIFLSGALLPAARLLWGCETRLLPGRPPGAWRGTTERRGSSHSASTPMRRTKAGAFQANWFARRRLSCR